MSVTPGPSETDLAKASMCDENALAGTGLGTLQMESMGRIILIPPPSSDANDPLNWSRAFKIYVTCVVCLAVWLSNFLAAGPTVDIVNIAIAYTDTSGTTYNIPKTAYLFTAAALMQGVGMFMWMPLITKYGRRVCYVFAFGFCTLCVLWAGLATDFNSELVARLGIGLFSGGAECLAPLTITDMFFVHERGRYMSFYQTFLSLGVSSGIVISGIIVYETDNWRNIYWLGAILYGLSTLVVILTFPETAFDRSNGQITETVPPKNSQMLLNSKKSYAQRLALFNGTFTDENLLKIFLRPFGAILLPAVAWAAMVFSVTIGFLVAITSNFAVALGGAPYNFNTLQLGLCFLSASIGALIAAPMGGWLGDWIAANGTSKNGGLREPEMRLPAIIPHIILAPFALVLYGMGIQHGYHWICPAVAFALFTFSTVAATNIAMMYAIDVYKPIAGEVVVAVVGFKGIIGFGLSFGTNLWVDSQGYQNAFGQMAAIAGVFLLGGLIFMFWGKKIRVASFEWRIVTWSKWHADRDDVRPGSILSEKTGDA
ncbi:MFS transporter [Athelia psychrophila]|uniref:MFS transporter n=1 Tax=Athelia psychrophila TaxID=1759441 RepID=A0A165YJW8_9AGAM|nr:MFS transporter [Fibularhizoctonia sp. CBS 109695]KZP27360.1 MFS transporter [Fibularhizoctonia sp. CBS 109695]